MVWYQSAYSVGQDGLDFLTKACNASLRVPANGLRLSMKIMEIQDLDSKQRRTYGFAPVDAASDQSRQRLDTNPMKSVHAHHRSSQNTLWLSFTDLLRTWRTNKPTKQLYFWPLRGLIYCEIRFDSQNGKFIYCSLYLCAF